MKNTLKIDFANSRIVMDRTFAKKCENTASEEYAQLQRVRADYPMFVVVRKKIKENPHKESYIEKSPLRISLVSKMRTGKPPPATLGRTL